MDNDKLPVSLKTRKHQAHTEEKGMIRHVKLHGQEQRPRPVPVFILRKFTAQAQSWRLNTRIQKNIFACHAMDCEASRYPTFPLIHSVSSMSKKANLVLTSRCIQMCRVSPCPCRLHSLLTNNCLKNVWTGCLRQWYNGYLPTILIKRHLFANGSLCLKSLKPMDYIGQRPQINSVEGRKEIN